jgi:hypothetical protein
MSVNFHTVGNTYQPHGTGDMGNVQNAPVSEEYLTIIKEFGLEDTAALRNSFADNAPGGADMSNLLSMSNKLDGMSGAMADVFTVMLLIAKMSQANKKTSQELRDAQQQNQLADMQNAANKIREAANFALAAGIVTGVMQMASGGVAIAGGAKGLADLRGIDTPSTTSTPWQSASVSPNTPRNPNITIGSRGGNAPPSSNTSAPTNTSSSAPQSGASHTLGADLGLERIRAEGRIFDGSAQVLNGLGSAIAAGLTRASEEARAEEKEFDAQAKMHEMLAEKESDFMSFNKDMIQKVAQIMKELIQLNTESEKAAATV